MHVAVKAAAVVVESGEGAAGLAVLVALVVVAVC